MSERPIAADGPARAPISSFTPWPYSDKSLWGTEVHWAKIPDPSVKLVIDEAGICFFTDPSGERGMWDPSIGAWVDPDTGDRLHPQFGIEGFELTADQKEALAQQLDAQVNEIRQRLADDPGMAYTNPDALKTMDRLAERAAELHSEAAPPQPHVGGET